MQVPILGTLFKSRDYFNRSTELAVLVTPYVVRATAQKNLARPDDGFAYPSDPATVLLGKLNRIAGLSCVKVKGAFYLFPNIAKTGLKSSEFCARLLDAEKVAAVPGIAFGADDYIRLSYATSMANIEKGLERIERFCKTLG